MKYITVTLLKELREQKGWSQELLAGIQGSQSVLFGV